MDIGSHGQPMSEATDPMASPDISGGWKYEPVGPVVDFAQQRLDRAKSAYEKNYPDADTSGHVWRVRRVDS
jgi:hypothetical protein